MNNSSPSHFKGKDAVGHVAEAQAKGIADTAEIHGAEIPGPVSAACDAAKESATALLFLWTLLWIFPLPFKTTLILLSIFAMGWSVWKGGRSAWLGWSRLERLHRIVAQEKWEIEHNRPQEKSELKALYAAKGLEGKLLDDVVDVLMSDGDRLLKVMVEEELGLTLKAHEHPLKQGLSAALGASVASFIIIASLLLHPYTPFFAAFLVIAIVSFIAARYEDNAEIPAVIWNVAILSVAYGFIYFLLDYLTGFAS